MKPEHRQQLDEVFRSALQREPGERAAFLDEACAGDDALRKQIEGLLAAREKAGGFIEKAAFEVAAESAVDDHNVLSLGQTIGHYQIPVTPWHRRNGGSVFSRWTQNLIAKWH